MTTKSGDNSSEQVASNLDQSPAPSHDVRCFDGEGQEGDTKNGKGTVVHSDGSRYEGEFCNGNYHGNGVLTIPDGSFYNGKWKDGVMHGHGQGVYSLANGDRYQGEFKQDEFHGSGILWLANGVVYVGSFEHGIANGKRTIKYPNKDSIYIGQWKDGKEHGFWTLIEVQGKWLDRFLVGNFVMGSGQIPKRPPRRTASSALEENGGESYVTFKNGKQTGRPEYKKRGMRAKLFLGFCAIFGYVVVGDFVFHYLVPVLF